MWGVFKAVQGGKNSKKLPPKGDGLEEIEKEEMKRCFEAKVWDRWAYSRL